MAFCSGCGEKIEDGVRFCSKCGKAVGGIFTDNKRQGSKNTLLLVGLIVGVLFLKTVFIVLFASVFTASESGFGVDIAYGHVSGFSAILNSLKDEPFGHLVLFLLIVKFICIIVAVILNIFAWVMNNAKLSLATAIVYGGLVLVSFFFLLPFLPMALCLVAYGQIKEQNNNVRTTSA